MSLRTKVRVGAEPAVVLQDRVQAFVVHPGGVQDHVRPGSGRVEHGLGAPGVHDDLLSDAVRLRDHRGRFILGVTGDQAGRRVHRIPVHGDLDEVRALLGLLADLRDPLFGGSGQDPDRRFGYANPRGIPVRQALPVGDLPAGGGDAWALEQTRFDGVAHRQGDDARGGGIGHGREAGLQDLLRAVQAAQRAVLDRREEIDVLLGLRVPVRKVDVGVDQAGHHEVVGVVQDLVPVAGRRRLARRTDEGQSAVVDNQGLVGTRGVLGRREERSAVDMRGHVNFLPDGAAVRGGIQMAATVWTSTRKSSRTSRSTMSSVFGGYFPFGKNFGNSRVRYSMNAGIHCECTM